MKIMQHFAGQTKLLHCACVPYYLPRHNTSVKVCFSKCIWTSPCDCECVADCELLSYSFEVNNKKENSSDLGLLYMSFKNKGFYPTVLAGKTTSTQLMAYCFKIVGVFNGFNNVMVFAEFFCYLTFKLWYSMKMYVKHNSD